MVVSNHLASTTTEVFQASQKLPTREQAEKLGDTLLGVTGEL